MAGAPENSNGPGPKKGRVSPPRIEIDFDAIHRVWDHVIVPDGTYLCRVAEVRAGTTRAGDERWSMRLVVHEGEHVGKQAAWDSVVFSRRGVPRARIVFRALGLPASGRVQVGPMDLEGRIAMVTIRATEYTAPGGEVLRRSEVPYDGFAPPPSAEGLRVKGEQYRKKR